MILTAQFNGAYGPVWLPVEAVVEYQHRWGGYAVVVVNGHERLVPHRRLRVEA